MASATGLLGSQSDKHGVRKGNTWGQPGKHALPPKRAERSRKSCLPRPGTGGRVARPVRGLVAVSRLEQTGAGVPPAGSVISESRHTEAGALAVRRGRLRA